MLTKAREPRLFEATVRCCHAPKKLQSILWEQILVEDTQRQLTRSASKAIIAVIAEGGSYGLGLAGLIHQEPPR
jgi:hypothetical protein